ncbi:MAG: hypothetical protein QOF14_5301, partial [Hyphomicrobiales bacterium]|nr:hypothetical protein [Hyphomicrobiales bacterium]
MERINQFAFYEMGKALKQFAAYRGNVSPETCMHDFFGARAQVKELLEGKPLPINFSRSATGAMKEWLDQIFETHYETIDAQGAKTFKYPKPDDAPIQGWRFDYFRHLISTFETVFEEEMREATTYFVPRRGIYWTPALVDAADQT